MWTRLLLSGVSGPTRSRPSAGHSPAGEIRHRAHVRPPVGAKPLAGRQRGKGAACGSSCPHAQWLHPYRTAPRPHLASAGRQQESTDLPAEISGLKSNPKSDKILHPSASLQALDVVPPVPRGHLEPPSHCCLQPSASQAPPCSDPWAQHPAGAGERGIPASGQSDGHRGPTPCSGVCGSPRRLSWVLLRRAGDTYSDKPATRGN